VRRLKLEGYIVIRRPSIGRQLFYCGAPGGTGVSHMVLAAGSPLALSLALPLALRLSLTLALSFRAPKQLDFPGYNIGKIAFLTLRVVPLVGPNTAFNIDLPAFGQIISTELSRFAEGNDTVPFRSLLPVAFCSGRDIVICCEVEFCNCDPVGTVSDVRVSPQSAN